CDAICHVVRAFSDSNIIKEGSINPQGDFEVICAELIIKDLETIDKYLDVNKNNAKENKSKKFTLATKLKTELEKGNLAVNLKLDDEEKEMIKEFFLLTAKPYFIVANVDEDTYKEISNFQFPISNENGIIPICAKVEFDLSELNQKDKKDYLKELGVNKSGLERVIQKAYDTLGLQSYYTAGVKEARAWTIKKGDTAPKAASAIHTDFEKGFIMAEVVSYNDFVQYQGLLGAKEAGKLRHEGRDYIMRPDDVVEFRINA
ncbi:MAG: DUF933 domain-containing protein, partial [Candidatus Shapirobacteria bacterium]